MIIPGDIIKINVDVDNIGLLKHEMVVSFIDNDKIITCGHCLPKNTKLSFGKIIYTSGFDNEDESKEIGIIKINSDKKKMFLNEIDGIKIERLFRTLSNGMLVFNFYNRNYKFGTVLKYTTSRMNKGYNFIEDWIIDNQITKLNVPYYIILGSDVPSDTSIYNNAVQTFKSYKFKNFESYIGKIYKMTSHGYSGSPWLVELGSKIFHFGIHIGKVLGVRTRNNKVLEIAEFAYVKPI